MDNKLFKVLALFLAVGMATSPCFGAWDKTKPTDSEKLKDSPALIRANWEAIETGTDAALQITNAKISASAGIVDTKLAEIGTANKVNGTSFKNLAGIPSGAGVIPAENIPSIDGSKLTGLANIPSGSGEIPIANLPTVTTAKGGTGSTANANAASGVVVLDASSRLPAVDGSQLINVVAGTLGGSIFGSWTSSSTDTVYLATTDGLAIVTDPTSGHDAPQGYTDASNPPTTKRGGATTSDGHGRSGCFTMPVKKGNYWKVTSAGAVEWLPIGA